MYRVKLRAPNALSLVVVVGEMKVLRKFSLLWIRARCFLRLPVEIYLTTHGSEQSLS